MQFDKHGNLYVYKPGAGCLGTPRKIDQGFSENDLNFTSSITSETSSQHVTNGGKSSGTLLRQNIHRLVPKVGVSSTGPATRFGKFQLKFMLHI